MSSLVVGNCSVEGILFKGNIAVYSVYSVYPLVSVDQHSSWCTCLGSTLRVCQKRMSRINIINSAHALKLMSPIEKRVQSLDVIFVTVPG